MMPDPVKVHIGAMIDPKFWPYGNLRGESVWAVRVGRHLYQVDNDPVTPTLALGDTVRCERIDGRLTAVGRYP